MSKIPRSLSFSISPHRVRDLSVFAALLERMALQSIPKARIKYQQPAMRIRIDNLLDDRLAALHLDILLDLERFQFRVLADETAA